jgi:hypothetical protein
VLHLRFSDRAADKMKALRPVYAGTYDGGVFAMTFFGIVKVLRSKRSKLAERVYGEVFIPYENRRLYVGHSIYDSGRSPDPSR